MEIQFILISLCVTLAASIDLGPYIRIAQCRIECLKEFTTDGTCNAFVNGDEIMCNECWNNCRNLHSKTYQDLCERVADDKDCPECKVICNFKPTTEEIDEFLPTALPAPEKPPSTLSKFDVAIVFKKVHNEWKDYGFYPGIALTGGLKTNTWIIVVAGDQIKQYTTNEWVPILEYLKPGDLYEATITWKNIDSQIRKNNLVEQKEFNDRVRQFYLEKYGHRVIHERESDGEFPASESVFKNFFFKRRSNADEKILGDDVQPHTSIDFHHDYVEDDSRKESWVVAWEPETGGLTGNQEADSTFAQITLLPGTKYRVRVASKDGPGSFPIEVDTSVSYIQIHRLKKNFENFYGWEIIAASTCFLIFITVFVIIKLLTKKSKKLAASEEEVEQVV